MAKKKSVAATGTKGQAVQQYLAEHPEASPKQVAAGLREQGIEVSESRVSQIKYGQRPAGGRKKKVASKLTVVGGPKKKLRRKKKAARRKVAVPQAGNSRPASAAVTVEDLVEAKRIADQLGGVGQARRALELLEQLR